MNDLVRCGVCWRQVPVDVASEERGVGRWYGCLGRAGCAAADARRMAAFTAAPVAETGPTDAAAIVEEWRAAGADIRLDVGGDYLHLGAGWCRLPEELRRRVQAQQRAIVEYLRDEAVGG